MGAKDSKPSFISYEEAVKRVPDNELRRIREAFKRCSTGNGMTLSLDAFVREVLCDGVPTEVAEWLYQACGGTKRGIAFKDLLCGIVVLTKGSVDEKIKFLWTLYVNNQSENGVYIYKWDFARTLHLENTSLPVTNAPKTAEILTGLFGAGDKVTYEQFRSWLLIHKEATVLSKWLLSDRSYNTAHDLETPTFYQSLAGVTHLEERDIIELEKCFWSLRNSAPTSQLDCESLTPLLSPPLPPAAVAGTFLAFDENRDGHVDFKELCCGLSAACRGPKTERLKFCFKIFDLDRDGALSKQELIDMVTILCQVANDDLSIREQSSRASTPEGNHSPDKTHDVDQTLLNLKEKLTNSPRTKPVFQLGPEQELIDIKSDTGEKDVKESDLYEFIADDMALTQEDFLLWSVESAEVLVSPFLDLIFEVCHIVLGLRPQCRHQERDIVLGWLRRSTARGYSVGQFWYLLSAEWWSQWAAYTGEPCHRHEAIVTDESFTSTSTESMGSLLYRADTASLGSASSSGVSSGVGASRHPGPIDNKRLLAPNVHKVRTLTGEGGHLRRDVTLAQHRDFELVPAALWRALALWYGGPDPLPRQVIRPPNSDVELELYPLHLKIYRHVTTQRSSIVPGVGAAMYGAAPTPPERQLAYTAAFSRRATVRQVIEFICSALGLPREHVRLWALRGSAADLLDDELPALETLPELSERSLLLEMRNQDLTWPEEIGALSMTNSTSGWNGRRATLAAPQLPGATGLHNLGNTCYMNAALQSVWNTGPLTRYFNSGMHLYEVNTRNPLGTKGVLALRYGELCKEVWSRSARSVAPLRVRWCVSRWARALAGGGQHDAQELLAWLLDQLHEDLNRARVEDAPAPAPVQEKTTGKKEDQVAATAAWEQYTMRNNSIMTDLFYGQLKSKVRCDTCGHESVQFDAFNMLSLPLPMESFVAVEIRVILLDGSVPVKYGVRVNSEGTYLDVKRKLTELCGLDPDLMLLVELAGARIGRHIPDAQRVKPIAAELCAYQLPDPGPHAHTDSDDAPPEEWLPAAAEPASPADPEVSARRGASLCMPALFCFKRSRSEALVSQSPPGLHDGRSDPPYPLRSNTLPKDLKKDPKSSPTLSVRSLTLKPSTPRLGATKFGSSPSNMHQMKEVAAAPQAIHYLVAVHRKQCRLDAYFLPSQRSRPALFGVPLLVELREHMSGRAIYAKVWTQLARLLSARPTRAEHNHATDCDDSLGYEFPFTLRVVNASGAWCGACPWSALCRGCALPSSGAPLVHNLAPRHGSTPRPHKRLNSGARRPSAGTPPADSDSPIARAKLQRQCSGRASVDANGETAASSELTRLDFDALRQVWGRGVMLAIDWDPTALHLRYQATREKACIEHESVRECTVEASRPIDLDHCLRAFTHNESLEQPYNCAGCRQASPATKKLQLWRLPPILIIHLKRFQFVNNKWIKSQKVVNFPFEDFDPTAYLASVPQETILRHRELKTMFNRRSSMFMSDHISESDSSDDEEKPDITVTATKTKINDRPKETVPHRTRKRLESSSLASTPVLDDNLIDYHKHHLLKDQDPFDIKYRLYAVVSHSGQLSGGHYVASARHPTGAWLCYNDSSCRELPAPPRLDPAAAYLLFYERAGLHTEPYLPDPAGRERVPGGADVPDPDDADLKRMCSVV